MNKQYKAYVLGFILMIAMMNSSYGQSLKLIKEEIKEVDHLENVFESEAQKKNAKLYAFTPANEKSYQMGPFKQIIKGSRYKTIGKGTKATIVGNYEKGSQTVKLSKRVNGIETHQIDMPYEGTIYPIDNTGRFFFSDYSHGSATGFYFYDANFKPVNTYRPYDYFTYPLHELTDDYVFVAAKEKAKSKEVKISKLTLSGELIKETLIETNGNGIFSLNYKNDQLVILLSGGESSPLTLVSLTGDLSVKWEKGVDPIPWNEVMITDSNEIITTSGTKIYLLDGVSGEEKWSYAVERIKSYDMVLNNEFLAFVSMNDDKSALVVLDKKSGEAVYSSEVELDMEYPVIIDDGDQFFIRNKSALLKFSKP